METIEISASQVLELIREKKTTLTSTLSSSGWNGVELVLGED